MFHATNLDVGQSRQTNDSASIVKRAKERFRYSEMLKKAQQEANKNATIIESVSECKQTLSIRITSGTGS